MTWAPSGNHVGPQGQSGGPPGAITQAPWGNHVGTQGKSRGPPGAFTWAPRGNNLRYADDTTLMAESEEELKNLVMKVKEESEKIGSKLNIQKSKIMASGPITSWQTDGDSGNSDRLYFLGLQNHCRW